MSFTDLENAAMAVKVAENLQDVPKDEADLTQRAAKESMEQTAAKVEETVESDASWVKRHPGILTAYFIFSVVQFILQCTTVHQGTPIEKYFASCGIFWAGCKLLMWIYTLSIWDPSRNSNDDCNICMCICLPWIIIITAIVAVMAPLIYPQGNFNEHRVRDVVRLRQKKDYKDFSYFFMFLEVVGAFVLLLLEGMDFAVIALLVTSASEVVERVVEYSILN